MRDRLIARSRTEMPFVFGRRCATSGVRRKRMRTRAETKPKVKTATKAATTSLIAHGLRPLGVQLPEVSNALCYLDAMCVD